MLDLLFYVFFCVSSIAAAVLNLALLITVTKTGIRDQKNYSLLIGNFAITDLICALCQLSIQGHTTSYGSLNLVLTPGPCCFFGTATCFIDHCIRFSMSNHANCSIALTFAYRYYVMERRTPRRKTVVYMVLMTFLPSLIDVFIMYVGFDAREDLELGLISRGQIIPSTCFFGHVNAGLWGPRTIFLFVFLCPLVIFILSNLLRYFIMKKVTAPIVQNVSPQTKLLENQCSKALMYQAFLPLFLCLSAATKTVEMLKLVDQPALGFIGMGWQFFPPLLSPIISFYYVPSYRKYLVSRISRNNTIDVTFQGPTIEK